jgi:hypothetical protein
VNRKGQYLRSASDEDIKKFNLQPGESVLALPLARKPHTGRLFVHPALPMPRWSSVEVVVLPDDEKAAQETIAGRNGSAGDLLLLSDQVTTGRERAWAPNERIPIVVVPPDLSQEMDAFQLGYWATAAGWVSGLVLRIKGVRYTDPELSGPRYLSLQL